MTRPIQPTLFDNPTLDEPFKLLPLDQYDVIAVCYSGGKDSLACLLHLLDLGIPRSKIELHHQDIDGHGEALMDWPCTPAYVKATGEALGIPVVFSWRDGGFVQEMMRDKAPTAGVSYERNGTRISLPTVRATEGTRLKFPQVSADLSVRWCSSALKIDPFARVLNNEPAYQGKKILVVTGERREESSARSKYDEAEEHRCNSRNRTVHHWRPVIDWTEHQVWDIIERHRVRPHPAYALGWGRTSCLACFAGETEVVTREGIKPIGELAGGTHQLLVPKRLPGGLSGHGTFQEAVVRSFGKQELLRVILTAGRHQKTIYATPGHRWLVTDHEARVRARNAPGRKPGTRVVLEPHTVERTTATLRRSDCVRNLRAQPLVAKCVQVPFAIAQGFVYGDGGKGVVDRPATVYFHGKKDEVMRPFFAGHKTVWREDRNRLDIYGIPRLWKEVPSLRESRSFLLSWLAGYFAADGTVSEAGQMRIDSASLESIRFVRTVAAICGIRHGAVRFVTRLGKGKAPSRLFGLTLNPNDVPDWFFFHGHHLERVIKRKHHESNRALVWTVQSVVQTDRVEEVFCAVVPGVAAFGLADGIMTGNCIFGDDDQWASVKGIAPERFERIASLEGGFGTTIKKGRTVEEMARKGTEFVSDKPDELRRLAMSPDAFTAEQFFLREGEEWKAPAGAYRRCGGPT